MTRLSRARYSSPVIPRGIPGERTTAPGDGDLVYCGRALPGMILRGIANAFRSFHASHPLPPLRPVPSLPLVILVFHLSISVILFALIFPRARLFRAALHPGNSVQEAGGKTIFT